MESKKKILLVEDESTLQRTLGAALRRAGFEVVSAVDGDEALRLVSSEHPHIVLLDLILPKRSGFEVLEEMKGSVATRDIPVVVLTNLESVGDVDRALELGANSFLVKANYGVEEVIEKVRQALNARGL